MSRPIPTALALGTAFVVAALLASAPPTVAAGLSPLPAFAAVHRTPPHRAPQRPRQHRSPRQHRVSSAVVPALPRSGLSLAPELLGAAGLVIVGLGLRAGLLRRAA